MTRVLAGLYVIIAAAFVAVNIYLAGTLTTDEVASLVGI
jgi:hypothetical protein